MEKMRRLFIAITLPKNIKRSLNEIIYQLRQDFPDLKYEKEEKLHLTLKFLGWTSLSEKRISEVLKKITTPMNSFDLTFSGIGFFFSFNFILYANLKENNSLLDLVARTEKEMKKLGFTREKRPFRSHITLARGKRKPATYWKELAQKISRKHFSLSLSFTVKEIVLMESTLNKEGSEYTIINNYSFRSIVVPS